MTECSICLIDNIPENEKCINNCGHTFCKSCIDNWFNSGKNICPMCRQIITYFDYHNEKYRVIFNTSNTSNTSNASNASNITINPSLVSVDRRIYNAFRLFVLGLSVFMGSQLFMIQSLYHQKYNLIDNLNNCLYNNTHLHNTIQLNHMIDLSDQDYIFMKQSHSNNVYFCKIPIYYINQCFT